VCDWTTCLQRTSAGERPVGCQERQEWTHETSASERSIWPVLLEEGTSWVMKVGDRLGWVTA